MMRMGSMGKYVAFLAVILIGMALVAMYSEQAGASMPGSDRDHSTEYKDKYLMALVTYDTVSNDKYAQIYTRTIRFDHSAARTYKDAARESCRADGGRLQEDFSCARR